MSTSNTNKPSHCGTETYPALDTSDFSPELLHPRHKIPRRATTRIRSTEAEERKYGPDWRKWPVGKTPQSRSRPKDSKF